MPIIVKQKALSILKAIKLSDCKVAINFTHMKAQTASIKAILINAVRRGEQTLRLVFTSRK